MTTFNESNSAITNSFTGKAVEYVTRNGKVLEFVTTCGHTIKLQADINGDIHFQGQSVNIILPDLMTLSKQGM